MVGGGTYDYTELSNKPQINGVTLSGNKSTSDLGIDIPTKVSDLQNDSGFIVTESDPTVPAAVKNITSTDISNWNNKQGALTAGSNITINRNTISATDTTYQIFSNGETTRNGLVPSDGSKNNAKYFLNGLGGWTEPEGTVYTAGTNISITNNQISATDTTYDNATTTNAGLMSAADKIKLDNTFKELTSPVTIWNLEDGIYLLPASCEVRYDPSSMYWTSSKSLLFVGTENSTTKRYFIFNGSGTINNIVNGKTTSSSGTIKYFSVSSDYETTSNKVTSISSSSTNTKYPSAKAVYDYVSSNAGFATSLTEDLYLVDGTYPTLTKGYYYTNEHSIYINGNVKTEFNDTIFFVDLVNTSTCLIYASILPQNNEMVQALYSGGVWLYSTNTLLQLSNINTSMPSTPTDDNVPSTKLLKNSLPTDFTGTDGSTAGTSGLVPAPATIDDGKFLCADGTWQETDSSVPIGSIMQYDGNTIPAGYEEVNGFENYSTTEQRVGTWIDGKPLYKITYQFVCPTTNSGQVTQDLTNLNFKKIIEISGIGEMQQSSTYYRVISNTYAYNLSSVTEFSGVWVNGKTLYYRYSGYNGLNSFNAYITLRYTKTTDTAS